MTEEGRVKKAIAKALSDKIINEIVKDLKKEEIEVRTGLDKDGIFRIEPSHNDSEVVKYLILKLAEKRYEYGMAMEKDPEEW